jgi:hypothetical protein
MKTTSHIPSLLVAICMMAIASCSKQQTSALKSTLADSLIAGATSKQDLDRAIFLSDSLESTGDISIFRSCYIKGSIYLRTGKPRDAEAILKRALESLVLAEGSSALIRFSHWRIQNVTTLCN